MFSPKNPILNVQKDILFFRIIGAVVALSLTLITFSFKNFDRDDKAKNSIYTPITIAEETIIVRKPKPKNTVVKKQSQNFVKGRNETIIAPDTQVILNASLGELPFPEFPSQEKPIVPKTFVFSATDVEEEAIFNAGDFYDFLDKNLLYPKTAELNNLTGTVNVHFIVRKDGTVDIEYIDGSPYLEFKIEAKRVIMLTSGKWIPAKVKKKGVDMRCVIPISFDEPDIY